MKELDRIYRKRKQQLIPLIFGFSAIFIFFRIILPQLADVGQVQDLISSKNSIISAKEATVMLLNSLSPEDVDIDYQIATTALPLQKDIVLIYDQLNKVAARSDVELGGFSVKIGDVYLAEGRDYKEKSVSGVPYLNIVVSVSGQNENMRKFAEELYKSIPLVEINTIDITRNSARYDVNFYYKSIAAKPKNADVMPLQPLNAVEKSQLETLSVWNE